MKFKKVISKAMAKASLHMAHKSCGVASQYGMHQPKEPAALRAKELKK